MRARLSVALIAALRLPVGLDPRACLAGLAPAAGFGVWFAATNVAWNVGIPMGIQPYLHATTLEHSRWLDPKI